jgi:hypothetical protein
MMNVECWQVSRIVWGTFDEIHWSFKACKGEKKPTQMMPEITAMTGSTLDRHMLDNHHAKGTYWFP